MITLNEKTMYRQCVIDVINITKHLFIFSTIVETEKKYGTPLNPQSKN